MCWCNSRVLKLIVHVCIIHIVIEVWSFILFVRLQDLPASEVELEVSEYSPEDDSSSAGGDHHDAATPPVRRESEAIIAAGILNSLLFFFCHDFLVPQNIYPYSLMKRQVQTIFKKIKNIILPFLYILLVLACCVPLHLRTILYIFSFYMKYVSQ